MGISRTGVEPGRTGPEGVGGPKRSQAGQDQRAWWEKQRVLERAGISSRNQQQPSARGHQREPEAQGSVAAEWPLWKQLQLFQSKPARDEGGKRRTNVF